MNTIKSSIITTKKKKIENLQKPDPNKHSPRVECFYDASGELVKLKPGESKIIDVIDEKAMMQ